MSEEWTEKNIKRPKKRKPMTEEQRQAAAERLAKARAAKGPVEYKNIHPKVVALPDEHPFSYMKIKEWMKHNRELASSLRSDIRRNINGSIAKLASVNGYLKIMSHYLKHNDWTGNYYGKDEHMRVRWKTIAPKQQ